ncbi:MAG TPA: hypothetical protein VK805_20285 [Candidatus Baltobacteraceae bacterium]|jgi:hypothetical protein|nr:hypothetical protein [Candidatus Baltobacteraceae bacterium]
MFSAYFDDSGTHLESDVAIAACYIGTLDRWKCLSDDWDAAKNAEGFTVFGMADILGGKGEFRGWKEYKRDRLIRRLITNIRCRASIGISISVPKVAYDKTIQGKIRGRFGKFHYTFAVRSCLTQIKGWRERHGITTPMQYVFDITSQGKGEIIEALEYHISTGRASLSGLESGGYSFQSKKGLPPLQAADILAHETYRCVLNELIVPGTLPDHYFGELVNGGLVTKYWTEEKLAGVRDSVSAKYDALGDWPEPLTNAKGPELKVKNEGI